MKSPDKFYGLPKRLRTMYRQLDAGRKKPYLGLTQGGSSARPHPGAKVAALDTNIYKPKRRKRDAT